MNPKNFAQFWYHRGFMAAKADAYANVEQAFKSESTDTAFDNEGDQRDAAVSFSSGYEAGTEKLRTS